MVVQSNGEWSFRPQGQLNESNWKKICPTPNPKPQTQQNPEIEIVASTYHSIRTSVPIFSPSEIRILQARNIAWHQCCFRQKKQKRISLSSFFRRLFRENAPHFYRLYGVLEYFLRRFAILFRLTCLSQIQCRV